MRAVFRTTYWSGSVAAAIVLGAGIWACGSSSGGGGGGAGNGDSGSSAPLTFQPRGCAYTVTIPATRAFTDFAPDDATPPADPSGATPARVRIGLGGGTTLGAAGYADPSTTAAFTWETAASMHGAKVKLGADPNSLTELHAGFSWTTPPPTVGFGSNEPPTYMHEVHVCGLTAGNTYYYQVGGGAAGAEVWSATQSFTTVPTTGKVTIGFSGDSRDKVDTYQLVQQRMRDAAVNIQLFSGDLVDIGTFEQLYTAALDKAWKDPQDATKFLTLGQQMIVPIAGNHENEAARFYGNFAIPGDDPNYAETYASFGVGGVHVAMLDDQSIATDQGGDPQAAAELAWLEKDLAAADGGRANHPFVVVVSHRGLFSTSLHGTDSDVLHARSKLAPLFDKYHVDLVVNGHDHEFEISKPLNAGADPGGAPVVKPAGQGTVYLISAGAGADPYEVGVSTADYRDTSTKFGNGTDFIGVYTIAEVDGKTLTVKTYGLKQAGGGVAGDSLLNTLVLTH